MNFIFAAIIWTVYCIGAGFLLGWFLKSRPQDQPNQPKE